MVVPHVGIAMFRTVSRLCSERRVRRYVWRSGRGGGLLLTDRMSCEDRCDLFFSGKAADAVQLYRLVATTQEQYPLATVIQYLQAQHPTRTTISEKSKRMSILS